MSRSLIAAALCIGLLLAPAAQAVQILNTLSGFGDRPGWQAVGEASADLSGGNTETRDYGLALAGQWQGEANRLRLIAGLDYAEASNETTKQDQRVHLRHNYRIDRWVSTLGFVQYQRNPFQDLRRRMLFGAGLRFEIRDQPANRLGVGVSAMYEVERLTDDSRADTWRLSTFIDFRRELADRTRAQIVGWYQPKLADFSDQRLSVAGELEVDLAGPLKLLLTASTAYDSDPPPSVDQFDWDVVAGLRVRI